jgi:hypothetical protein
VIETSKRLPPDRAGSILFINGAARNKNMLVFQFPFIILRLSLMLLRLGRSFGRNVIDIIDIRASPAIDHLPNALYFHYPEKVTSQAFN